MLLIILASGSVAAGIQSGIGAVKAGSAFALAQSITMTPAILAAASGGAVFGTGALAASGVTEFATTIKNLLLSLGMTEKSSSRWWNCSIDLRIS